MNDGPGYRERRWATVGPGWPHRHCSRFVTAGGLRWHLQEFGTGPAVLLLHGTGAATHSWRGLAPLLASSFRVLVPDLPGHGFTERPPRGLLPGDGMSIDGMGEAVGALLGHLGVAPELVVGHSAGVAVAARMILAGRIRPRGLVSVNGAMLPLHGWLGFAFNASARLLVMTPFLPNLLARRVGSPEAVRRVMADTGSSLDEEGFALYAALAADPDHVAAVFAMMANWDLISLAQDLPRLPCPVVLVAGERDGMVPPDAARRLAELVPRGRLVRLAGLGHLAHEERPEAIAALVLELAGETGLTRQPARSDHAAA